MKDKTMKQLSNNTIINDTFINPIFSKNLKGAIKQSIEYNFDRQPIEKSIKNLINRIEGYRPFKNKYSISKIEIDYVNKTVKDLVLFDNQNFIYYRLDL
tara:strand:+ start:135 stop:431 length:297 start_codon:yes stop_codon:yes gene_type:complete